MTKFILATVMMCAGFAAASTTSAPTDDPPETGTCSYTCTTNNVTYLNRTQCRAACTTGACVVEAC